MPLKIQINGVKKTIADAHATPYVFINGNKKRLVKGVTFVNGQKKIIWQADDLGIAYIKGTSGLVGNTYGKVIYVTANKLILNYGSMITRLDISNISQPTVENSVQMGNVYAYSLPDSTSANLVFYAGQQYVANVLQGFYQQININPVDCAVSASNYKTHTRTTEYIIRGAWFINNQWLECIETGRGSSSTFESTLTFYYNGASKYNYVYSSAGQGLTDSYKQNPFLAKATASNLMGTRPTWKSGNSLATYTTSDNIIRVNNVDFDTVMAEEDGTFVAAGVSGFGIYNSDYSQKVLVASGAGRGCKLIGRIRNYYYVAEGPLTQDTADQSIVLKTFTKAGDLFNTRTLDLPAFSWTVGAGTKGTGFLLFTFCIPHVSPSGYLAFTYQPGQDIAGPAKGAAIIVRIQGY